MRQSPPYASTFLDPLNAEQVQFWAQDIEVDPQQLKAAVSVVGPRLIDLRSYFGKSARIVFLKQALSDRQGGVSIKSSDKGGLNASSQKADHTGP